MVNDPKCRENGVHDSNPPKETPIVYTYVHNENMLKRVGSYKYFGITISTSDSRWDTHINNVVTKANTKLRILNC